MEYPPGDYKFYIQDMSTGDIECAEYSYTGKGLDSDVAQRNISVMLSEIFLQDDSHNGKWGDTIYDSFRTKIEHTNNGEEVSFHFPKDSTEYEPPCPHEDFEFLKSHEYVSDVPITVADKISKKIENKIEEPTMSDDTHPMHLSSVPYATGVPDLLAWNYEDPRFSTSMFVEVKSENDGIRLTQAKWFEKYRSLFDVYTMWIEKS